jgi:hypothetical protein
VPHHYGGWEPDDVNADLIRRFVVEHRKEDAALQFKGGRAFDPAEIPDRQRRQQILRDILARYVCAFANGEGGLLVIGVHTDTDPKSKRDLATGWECTSEDLSAQRIRDLVMQVADPRFTGAFLSGVRADTFGDPADPTRHGCWVLVPKSHDATHQVRDGTYDGQYLVSTQEGVIPIRHDDLVRRLCSRGLKLSIPEATVARGSHGRGGPTGAHADFTVTLCVRNHGPGSASDLVVEAYVAGTRLPTGARAGFGPWPGGHDEWPRVTSRDGYHVHRTPAGQTLHEDSDVRITHHVYLESGRNSPLDAEYVAAYRAKASEGQSGVYILGFGTRRVAGAADDGWSEPLVVRRLEEVEADTLKGQLRFLAGPNVVDANCPQDASTETAP